jgi:hypothetical protein
MEIYLYVMTFLLAFSTIGKIQWIAKDEYPRRERKHEVWDVVINIILMVWAINLLVI